MKFCAATTAILISIATQGFAQSENYLSHIMADALQQHSNIEVVSHASIAVLQNGTKTFLSLQIFPFQPKVNGAIRAEISLDPPIEPDSTATYTWRFRIPHDFQSDAPRNRWWVMAQWHDQPDINAGETWESKPDTSPAVALGYGQIDGVDYFGMSYGAPEQREIALIPFTRGEWHDMKMVIDWSMGPDGSATFYMDDMTNPVGHAEGRNMYNAARSYFKLGMYRDPAIHINSIVHIDNINITSN